MKPINSAARVKCIKKIIINANSVDVWNVMTDINNWDKWQIHIKSPELKGALREGTPFSWKTGGIRLNTVLHTVEPYTHIGWSGKSLGVYAIHNWTITELNKQTEVLVEESMEGLLTWILKPILKSTLEKANQNWLNLLKKECERYQK